MLNLIDKEFHSEEFLNLTKRQMELRCQEFEVVPDGNVFTQSSYPITSIRILPKGINLIVDYLNNKHKININTTAYLIQQERYSSYPQDSMKITTNQADSLKSKFLFDTINNGETQGVIIILMNGIKRLLHTTPIIFGKEQNGDKFAIILDPYFYHFYNTPDENSSSLTFLRFFKQHFDNIEIYCHDTRIQVDCHNCWTLSLLELEHLLKNNAKNAKKLRQGTEKIELHSQFDNKLEFNKFQFTGDIIKYTQGKRNYDQFLDHNIQTSDQKTIDDFINENKIYVKFCTTHRPYDPDSLYIPDNFEEKEINSALIKTGHKFVKLICKIKKENPLEGRYNPEYWIKLIEEQHQKENQKNKFLKLMKSIKKAIEKEEIFNI